MNSRRAPFALALLLTLGVAVIAGAAGAELIEDKGQEANHEEGLSDTERRALQTKARGEFEERYAAWLAEFAATGKDARSLERIPVSVFILPPEPDLSSAAKRADAIAVGRVLSVRYEPHRGGLLEIAVTNVIKGSLPSTVYVHQASSPWPDPDYSTGTLAWFENELPLFPGDTAVLFLVVDGGSGVYAIENGNSYLIEDGVVRAVETNPFRNEVEGKSQEAFLHLIASALR